MMRVVLDANVVVSSFLQSSGPSGRIVRRFIEDQSFSLILSEPIFQEWKRSLLYPRVQKYLKIPSIQLDRWLVCLRVLGEFVRPEMTIDVIQEDPDDNKYIAAALEGKADYIVSGDRHLLDLGSYEEVKIVTPRVFLTILSK